MEDDHGVFQSISKTHEVAPRDAESPTHDDTAANDDLQEMYDEVCLERDTLRIELNDAHIYISQLEAEKAEVTWKLVQTEHQLAETKSEEAFWKLEARRGFKRKTNS